MPDASPRHTRDFPPTARTWIESCILDEARRAEVHRHVMTVYAAPLATFVRALGFRRLGDAEDLVNGFFAEALFNERFLLSWLEGGGPLRSWLRVAMYNWLRAEARREDRAGRVALIDPAKLDQLAVADAARQYDAGIARGLVADALRRAHAGLAARGFEAHWTVFVIHQVFDRSLGVAGSQVGVSAVRASVMSRTAQRFFERSLAEAANWPTATADELTREIRQLKEALR